MKKTVLVLLTILLNVNISYTQAESEIDSLLTRISEIDNSKEITNTEHARKIVALGENSLLILAEFFTDLTQTKVKSECQERYLTKGDCNYYG